jgi:hypothetical protein
MGRGQGARGRAYYLERAERGKGCARFKRSQAASAAKGRRFVWGCRRPFSATTAGQVLSLPAPERSAPPSNDSEAWWSWIPEIVIEIVSPGSEQRDYDEKREEYLRFGVQEYWVVDAVRREVLILRRRGGRWAERVLRPPDVWRSRLLPGFEFACAPVFDAVDAVGG